MGEPVIVLEGGTVVTAYGSMEADVWIDRGKIRRVARGELEVVRESSKRPLERFDARDYFVLPGWVGLSRLQVINCASAGQYRETVQTLIGQGITSLVDTVDIDLPLRLDDVWYQLTPHYDSPIDYGVRVRLPAAAFTPAHVRRLRDEGIRLLEVTVNGPDDVNRIAWRDLYPFLNQAKIAVHLHVAEEQESVRERRETALKWLRACQYGKVRTCVSGVDPLTDGGSDPYYGVVMLDADQLGRVLQHLRRQWFGYFPVCFPLNRGDAVMAWKEGDPVKLLSLLVRLMSANVAKTVGTYPKKGSLMPGADADVILLEKGEWLTKIDNSTMLNSSELCHPAYVMSKGKWLYCRGNHVRATGCGIRLRELQPYNYVM